MAEVDVVLYGATGYTGRLIAEALDARGAAYAIAGRDAGKLDALSRELPSNPPTVTAPLDDANALTRMAEGARVVLSAAGPFDTMGPPVMEAALAAGTHFADITGEQSFLRWAAERDADARAAGVTVVNALGFDVVPSDFAAALAAEGLDEVRLVDVCIRTNSGISGGTRRSMAASAGKGWWFDRGRYRRGPPGRFARDFMFPEEGSLTGVFIPWGDVVTAPRSTGASRVRTFFSIQRSRALGLRLAWPILDLATRTPWFKRRDPATLPPVGSGPSGDVRARSRFTIVAEAFAADGRAQRGVTRGRDPYGLTAAAAAHGAMLIAEGRARGKGVLTPSQAFDRAEFGKALDAFDFEGFRETVT